MQYLKLFFHFILFLLTTALAAGMSACTAAPPPLNPGEWQAGDLLALDPPGDPLTRPLPGGERSGVEGADLIAVYARPSLQALHLRLDLLDFSSGQSADLYIALDSSPGGTTALPLGGASEVEWDALLLIPASGALQVLDSSLNPLPDSALRVARSPGSHSIAISLDPASLPGAAATPLRLEVISTLPGSREIADRVAPLSPQTPNPQALPTLLAFWDTFPVSTPAQALRRWDGAHTGPLGGRHGLYNLLRTARARQIPLALLDLGSPQALAALDYAAGTPLLAEIALDRQNALPASLPGLLMEAGGVLPLVDSGLLAAWLEGSRESQLAFALPASPFVYAPLSAAQFPALLEALQGSGSRTIFTVAGGQEGYFGRAERLGEHTLLVLPQKPAGIASDRLDISLEARRELAQAAWDWNAAGGETAEFLVIGGSLPESPFGSPQYARQAFQYLQEHPWIRLLSAYDLEVTPHLASPLWGEGSTNDLNSSQGGEEEQVVIHRPETGWGVDFLRAIYTQPFPAPPGLGELRAGYLGLLDALDAAAAWAANPTPRLDCAADPDRDGAAECILASESFYAQIETEDGRLTLAISRREAGAHLLVAPGYLLVSGLSDPASWDLAAGELADPQVLAGGFGGGGGPYSLEILADGVRLSSPDGSPEAGTVKEYRLARGGLAFDVRGPEASVWQLPLVGVPGSRSAPEWWEAYALEQAENSLRWRVGGVEFEVQSSTPGRLVSFRDGEALLGLPENPERELPAGMFLPLGMAVLEWEGDVTGWLR